MKCCNCGKEYDEKNKPVAVNIHRWGSTKRLPIRSISDINDKTVAFCPDCIRAFVIGFGKLSKEYDVDVAVMYEESEKEFHQD